MMQQLPSSCQTITIACGCLLVQLSTIIPTQAQQPQVIAPPPLPAICSSQLPAAIDGIIDRPELRRYRWGIVVQELGRTTQLYNRDGDRLFIPASNVKLITTAVALRQLGASTRLRTSIYQLPSNRNPNNLLVVGRGDPSVTVSSLQSLSQQLQQLGIKQIGQISFDDGYFRGEQINSGWEWGDLSTDYAPTINGLMLNQNSNPLTVSPQQVGMPLRFTWKNPSLNNWQIDNQSLTVTANQANNADAIAIFGRSTIRLTGKLAVNATPIQIDLPLVYPAESFISAFRQSLNQAKITVERTQLVSGQNLSNLPEVAAINSPTITELITETNQHSNNVYAEVLLRSIGRTHPESTTSQQDTSRLGIALVNQNLMLMGVDAQAYSLYDGSGLSRHNLVAPTTFVRVLAAMAITSGTAELNASTAQAYRDSLPIAGVSGSLKNRMKGTLAQGIVRAKTGSMSGVVSLSGYINPPQYPPLVFSIILNQHNRPTSQMVKVIDEVVVILARLKQC